MIFKCALCNNTYAATELIWKCDCGGYLLCDYEVKFTKEDIKNERVNMWRYDKAFPLKYNDLTVSYNEGMTPLVKYPNPEINLRIKMDYLMPTGSFKDRGTVMVINYLIQNGAELITEDSSGNAGSSVALYSAMGGIPCEIYVPEGTSKGKLAQMYASGAKVVEISGTREAVAEAAQEHTESYAGHNWHPMFLEGTKSVAYELWEQNGFTAPKNIVMVAGAGSQVLGCYNGFTELLNNGQIQEMPKIFAIQAENCNPIYRKFKGLDPLEASKKTVAEGISLLNPVKMDYVVDAMHKLGGTMISVSEEEIIDSLLEMCRNGFYVEPTSASALAGLKKLYEDGTISKDEEVVLIASGNGLKASETINSFIK